MCDWYTCAVAVPFLGRCEQMLFYTDKAPTTLQSWFHPNPMWSMDEFRGLIDKKSGWINGRCVTEKLPCGRPHGSCTVQFHLLLILHLLCNGDSSKISGNNSVEFPFLCPLGDNPSTTATDLVITIFFHTCSFMTSGSAMEISGIANPGGKAILK